MFLWLVALFLLSFEEEEADKAEVQSFAVFTELRLILLPPLLRTMAIFIAVDSVDVE